MTSDVVYSMRRMIELAKGRKLKQDLISRIPAIYWQMAYHPHFTYQFNSGSIIKDISGTGDSAFTVKTWSLLNRLRERKITGQLAKKALVQEIRGLSYESGELLKMIIFKDFRCGVGPKSILAVYPNLFPSGFCMKGDDFDPAYVTYPAWCSFKEDGLRGVLREGKLYSSSGREYYGLQHITEEFRRRGIMDGVDGEIVVPGMPFDTASGYIRSKKSSPAARLLVFDYISDEPLETRLMQARRLCKGLIFSTYLTHYCFMNEDDINRFFIHATTQKGKEGIMIKRDRSLYTFGRSRDWLKLKKEITYDLKVTGVAPGRGKYFNSMGYLVLDGGLHCGSGFTDAQRRAWFNDPSLILGKIVEVCSMEASSKGKLRHPRFIRIREDKGS